MIESDIELITNYFLNLNPEFLNQLGIDKNNLPNKTQWIEKPVTNKRKIKLIMNFRKATENDVSIIVEMIADDELGKKKIKS
ncbi:hypothetical protein [Psychroserpens sp.]